MTARRAATLEPSKLTLAALRLLVVDWRRVGRTVPVRLSRIVAEPWNEARMKRCREKLAAGLKPPPVKLVGFRIGARAIYEPGDGNHRCCAAREAGRSHVAAELSGDNLCDPAPFAIYGGKLLRETGDPDLPWKWVWDLDDPALADELVRLGVRRLDPVGAADGGRAPTSSVIAPHETGADHEAG